MPKKDKATLKVSAGCIYDSIVRGNRIAEQFRFDMNKESATRDMLKVQVLMPVRSANLRKKLGDVFDGLFVQGASRGFFNRREVEALLKLRAVWQGCFTMHFGEREPRGIEVGFHACQA